MTTRRITLSRLSALSLPLLLSACNADENSKALSMQKEVVLDVVLFSYLNKPIFDVYLDDGDIGMAGAWPHSGKAIMTAVNITLGPQTLTWRDAGSGANFVAKNPLILNINDIPVDSRYLGVHIYPDESAELIASIGIPEKSVRGKKIAEEFKNNGQ